MSDYFEELGHTVDDTEEDPSEDYNHLHDLAIIHGIDMDIEIPDYIKHSIAALPGLCLTEDNCESIRECYVCKKDPTTGENYKTLACNHNFHKDCISIWLQKAIADENVKPCPLNCELNDTLGEQIGQLKRSYKESCRRRKENIVSMFC